MNGGKTALFQWVGPPKTKDVFAFPAPECRAICLLLMSVRLFKRNYDMLKEAEHIINWQHYDAPQYCFIICLLLSNWLYRNILECTLSTCNNDYLVNELSHILCKFLVNLSFCAANDLSPFKRARREKNHLFWPENGNAVQERLFAVKKIKTLIGSQFVYLLKLFIDVALILN